MIEVLAIAYFCKGERSLSTFKDLGCKITLVSREKMRDEPWPRDLVDEVFFVKDFRNRRDVLNAVSYLHQERNFRLVAPLDEYAVGTAATLRAHLACPGLDEGTTRKVRDKLSMRCVAQEHGIAIPGFCGFNNRAQIGELLSLSDGPWMLKPRSAGGSVRILKLTSADQVWNTYEELGDARSHHILEEFLPSKVFHVDTIVSGGNILLEVAGEYLAPPFDVWHGGGVFAARTVPRQSQICQDLLAINREVIQAIGLTDGVNHAEYLYREGKLYFLEIAARVPGSNLDLLSRASTGVDLYVESAKIQFAQVDGSDYRLEPFIYKEAGLVQCLAQQENPDLGELANLSETAWILNKKHHAGVAYAHRNSARIDELMTRTLQQFQNDHLAVLPASASPG